MPISTKDFSSDFSPDNELVKAAQEGNLEAVQYWMAAGADPNVRDGAAYVLGAANNHFDVVEFLYPFVTESVRSLGLEIATFNQNVAMVDFLYTHDHAKVALPNLLGGIRDHAELGLEKVLKNRMQNDPNPSAPSKIKRKIFN